MVINLFVRQFIDVGFFDMIWQVIIEIGVLFEWFELEMLVELLNEDLWVLCELLVVLYDFGVCLIFDDFGIGFCFLVVLQQLLLDVIKIDYCFICDIFYNVSVIDVVLVVIVLVCKLYLMVVVEGVEILQ